MLFLLFCFRIISLVAPVLLGAPSLGQRSSPETDESNAGISHQSPLSSKSSVDVAQKKTTAEDSTEKSPCSTEDRSSDDISCKATATNNNEKSHSEETIEPSSVVKGDISSSPEDIIELPQTAPPVEDVAIALKILGLPHSSLPGGIDNKDGVNSEVGAENNLHVYDEISSRPLGNNNVNKLHDTKENEDPNSSDPSAENKPSSDDVLEIVPHSGVQFVATTEKSHITIDKENEEHNNVVDVSSPLEHVSFLCSM